MTYECRGCGKKDDAGQGRLEDVYPRMVFNWKSEILCASCKARLETWLTDKWREWFKLQLQNSSERKQVL
jgi:hypothetical protein